MLGVPSSPEKASLCWHRWPRMQSIPQSPVLANGPGRGLRLQASL
jgi:hypothetical protein